MTLTQHERAVVCSTVHRAKCPDLLNLSLPTPILAHAVQELSRNNIVVTVVGGAVPTLTTYRTVFMRSDIRGLLCTHATRRRQDQTHPKTVAYSEIPGIVMDIARTRAAAAFGCLSDWLPLAQKKTAQE